MDIELILSLEEELNKRMPENGYFEERDNYLTKEGIYKEWNNIFIQYAELGVKGNSEALKRALFLFWYQFSEPAQLTGLLNLDKKASTKILFHINQLAELRELDNELIFMLPFYYQVCDWYFDNYGFFESLLNISQTNVDLWQKNIKSCNLSNRGVMGKYWLSMAYNKSLKRD